MEEDRKSWTRRMPDQGYMTWSKSKIERRVLGEELEKSQWIKENKKLLASFDNHQEGCSMLCGKGRV